MQNRITMNLKSLQAKFPEVYREFFSKFGFLFCILDVSLIIYLI